MDYARRQLLNLAAALLYVYTGQCASCGQTFDTAAECADTDMVSCFCGSVYSCQDRQLVIAPLTEEEISRGPAGRLEQRVNAACPGRHYQYFGYRGDWRCPLCGSPAPARESRAQPLREYCARHPNTLILYADGAIQMLRAEFQRAAL